MANQQQRLQRTGCRSSRQSPSHSRAAAHRAAAQIDDRLPIKLVVAVGHLRVQKHSARCHKAQPWHRTVAQQKRLQPLHPAAHTRSQASAAGPHRVQQAGGQVGACGILLQLYFGLLKRSNLLRAGRAGSSEWGRASRQERRQAAAAASEAKCGHILAARATCFASGCLHAGVPASAIPAP